MPVKKMADLDLNGKRILIRQDLNVPVKDGEITSDIRLYAVDPVFFHTN
jgi:phosphoglycerate kinase